MSLKITGLDRISSAWNNSCLSIDNKTGNIISRPLKANEVYYVSLEIFDLDKLEDDVLVTARWQEAGGNMNRMVNLDRAKYKSIIREILADDDLSQSITDDWFGMNRMLKAGKRESYNSEMKYMHTLYKLYGGGDLNEAAMVITICINYIKSNLICIKRLKEAVKEFAPIRFRIVK